MSGTCEKIGFSDFSTTHFQYFTGLKTGPNSISSHVPGTAALTNEDVMKMVQAKLADAIIVAKVRSSTCQFDTSTDALIKLKGAGVPSSAPS